MNKKIKMKNKYFKTLKVYKRKIENSKTWLDEWREINTSTRLQLIISINILRISMEKFSVNNDCWIWDQQNSMIIGTHGIENSRGFCPYPRPCAILGDWLPLTGKERGLHILNWNCKQILLINVYFPSDQRYFT